jgi:hypothetical protein
MELSGQLDNLSALPRGKELPVFIEQEVGLVLNGVDTALPGNRILIVSLYLVILLT